MFNWTGSGNKDDEKNNNNNNNNNNDNKNQTNNTTSSESTNANTNPPVTETPEEKRRRIAEMREKRLAAMNMPMATTVEDTKPVNEPKAPSKGTKPNTESSGATKGTKKNTMEHLASEMKSVQMNETSAKSSNTSSSNIQSQPPKKEVKKSEEESKTEVREKSPGAATGIDDRKQQLLEKRSKAWQYLCVVYVFQIKHPDNNEYLQSLSLVPAFKTQGFITDMSYENNYKEVDKDTPFQTDSVEAIILDRFQAGFNTSSDCSFKYLIQCYERTQSLINRINDSWDLTLSIEKQLAITETARTSIVTFSSISLTTKDLVSENDFFRSRQEFMHLLSSSSMGRTFPSDFLNKLLDGVEEMDDMLKLLLPALEGVKYDVRQWEGCILALSKIIGSTKFALYLMESMQWNPYQKIDYRVTGEITPQTLLGAFLNIDSTTRGLSDHLFDGLSTTQDRMKIHNSMQEFRSLIHSVQDNVSNVVRTIVRNKDPQCRQKIAELVNFWISINSSRGKMRFDPRKVSTDGFMLNLNHILLVLCDPIVSKSMKDVIDPKYFLKSSEPKKVNWDGVTRMSASLDDLKTYGEEELPEFGFGTEIFWLALESFHLGFSSVSQDLGNLKRFIDRRRAEIRGNPMMRLLQIQIDKTEDIFLGKVAHTFDPRLIDSLGRFYGFFCEYLLYLYNKPDGKKLLSIIPEHYIEDMSRCFKLHSDGPTSMGQSPFNRQTVLRCILYLMGSETPLKSLYLRACLLDVLMSFLPPEVDKIELSSEEFEKNRVWMYQHEQHEFNRFEICQKEFVPVLLALYRDVERTGHAQQYYEKFKFRAQISRILKFLFQFKPHLDNLHACWNNNGETFVGFLNMLINDLIFSLDHGLDGIVEVREMEETSTNNLTESEQEQKTNEIAEKRDQIKYYMLLAYESLDLLHFISVQMQKPFFHEHILPRMATLVSVYLDRLAGKTAQLKVDNMEQYNFKPRFLLTTIVKMVIALSVSDEFLGALVGDDAMFRQENYEKALRFLKKHQLLPSHQVDKFETIFQELLHKAEERRNVESILGEIPDKYLDPLMYTLMRDPVRLPSSNKKEYVMDRQVIERHLLNNPNNPFTRDPLSVEELVPDVELKKEIDKWINDQIRQHKQKEKEKSTKEPEK